MKKHQLIIVVWLCSCTSISFAQTPSWLWANSIGSTSRDYGRSLAVDAAGNVFTAGTYVGTVDFDPGNGVYNLFSGGGLAVFVSKLDANGNFVWAKTIKGMKASCNSIALDANANVHITGYFNGTLDFNPDSLISYILSASGVGDPYVCKLDSSGNFIWAKQFEGGGNEEGRSVTVDLAGNVYSTGYFNGSVDMDPGSGTFYLTSIGIQSLHDVYISKLDNSGNFVWAKQVGGTSDEWGYCIAADRNSISDVFVTGFFKETADFDPNAGVNNLTAFGGYDVFVLRLDPSGNMVWADAMGGPVNYDYAYGIAVDFAGSGDVLVTGSYGGSADFNPGANVSSLTSAGYSDIFVCRLNASGNLVWAKSMGGPGGDAGYSVAVSQNGGAYATGYYTATADFDPGAGSFPLTSAGATDVFVTRLDGAGQMVWATSVGGAEYEFAESIAIDAGNHAHITGYYYSQSVAFGPFNLVNASTTPYEDIFIAKLDEITGLQTEINNDGIFIFPNPANEQFTIVTGVNDQEANITITDLAGKSVYNRSGMFQKLNIKTSGFDNGLYMVQLQTRNFIQTKKLLILN